MKPNRFKHLAQKKDQPLIFDPVTKKNPQDATIRQKKAIDILKITLRNSYNELVATPHWALPDDYTTRLAQTIRDIIKDAVKYNQQFSEASRDEDRPDLPQVDDKQMQVSDKLIYDLMNDINKTYKEK